MPTDARAGLICLTLVTDRRRLAGRDLATLAGEAARAGIDRIQVREKDLDGRALRYLVDDMLRAVTGTVAEVFVNGRPDVAEVTGACGVHLPEDGLPVAEVKRAFPRLAIGASCHSLEAARRAEEEGADFVVLGPIFATPGKEDRCLGLAPLSEVALRLRIPVHAIGGVEARNIRQVVAAGARGAAAIRPFLEGTVAEAVRAFRGAVEA